MGSQRVEGLRRDASRTRGFLGEIHLVPLPRVVVRVEPAKTGPGDPYVPSVAMRLVGPAGQEKAPNRMGSGLGVRAEVSDPRGDRNRREGLQGPVSPRGVAVGVYEHGEDLVENIWMRLLARVLMHVPPVHKHHPVLFEDLAQV